MKRIHLWIILAASVITLIICFLIPGNQTDAIEIPPVYGMGIANPQHLSNPPAPGHFYVIAVDRLTIRDIIENKSVFEEILQTGAIGLMSTGVDGSMVPDSTFASIGAGLPLNAYGTAARGMNDNELFHESPAKDVFKQRTGLKPPENSVIHLDIARIKKLNANSAYSAVPGLMGSMLLENGYNVRVFGNSDTTGNPKRPAVGLAMNKNGIVAEGDVGEKTTELDDQFPGHIRTDYGALLNMLGMSPTSSGLTVVELGDLARLEMIGGYLEEQVLLEKRRESIIRITAFIDTIAGKMDPEKDRILIVSPTPRGNNVHTTNYVTPVIMLGAGIEPGLLTSPSTRRPGIIKNYDLAPTVLHHYHIQMQTGTSGRPLQVIPNDIDQSLTGLGSLYQELELNYHTRPPALRYYVLAQLVLVILSLASILIPGRKTLMLALKPLLLTVMSVPLALLLVPLLPHTSIEIMVVQLIAVTAGITTLIHLWLRNYNNELDPFIFISLLTSICILADLILGAPLQKNSLLGYDPIVGARFYGVGNEYMGILLGATVIGTTALATRLSLSRKIMLPAIGTYYLITLYIIAAPQLGTNVGGSIAGAGSFLVTLLLLAGVQFNIKTVLKIAGAVGLVLLSLIFYDLSRPLESQSHIGRTAELIAKGGPAEIFNIINRKLSMNLKLLRYTIWSRVFLASLFTLAILFYRPVGVMQSLNARHPELYRGFIGVVIASLLALIFNDSGVVAAATAMIFGAPPLLYLVIRTLVSRAANDLIQESGVRSQESE